MIWVNNREAGGLRRHRAHYDVTVMIEWNNWYRVWGHGCDTTDSQMSPQPRRSRGCSDIWESVVSQPWPKTRYQFLFYHGTTKLTLNQKSLSIQTASQLSKFKGQSHCKHWVTWPDCFATPSNHCDVTAGLVSLNYTDTLDKKMWQKFAMIQRELQEDIEKILLTYI